MLWASTTGFLHGFRGLASPLTEDLFTGPCNAAQHRGTQVYLCHRNRLLTEDNGTLVLGLHAGEKSWALD